MYENIMIFLFVNFNFEFVLKVNLSGESRIFLKNDVGEIVYLCRKIFKICILNFILNYK